MAMTRARTPSIPSPPLGRTGGRLLGYLIVLLVGASLGLAIGPSETSTTLVSPDPVVPESRTQRTVEGVRVGYERTQAGAILAATNFESVIGSPLMLDDARRVAAMKVMAHPDHVDRLQVRASDYVRSIERGLNVGVGGAAAFKPDYRVVPMGFRVESYSPEAATIAIWTVSAGGIGPIEPIAGWGTATVSLGWAAGDWRLIETRSTAGPTPKADASAPTPAADFANQAAAFSAYSYAP